MLFRMYEALYAPLQSLNFIIMECVQMKLICLDVGLRFSEMFSVSEYLVANARLERGWRPMRPCPHARARMLLIGQTPSTRPQLLDPVRTDHTAPQTELANS